MGRKKSNIDPLPRIVRAALEVFAEQSYVSATVVEIARRAHISRRDLYARFPNKTALLIAVRNSVMQSEEENFLRAIAHATELRTLPEKLDVVGLALMTEVLSPTSRFIVRIILSECVNQPSIGAVFLDTWYIRRCEAISRLLSQHISHKKKRLDQDLDINQAAKHYIALVVQQPQLNAAVDSRHLWSPQSVQRHVKSAIDCFVKGYSGLA